MPVTCTKTWLAALSPLTKPGDFEDCFFNLSASDGGVVRWDEFQQLGLQEKTGLLAVLSASSQLDPLLLVCLEDDGDFACRCASLSNSLRSSQWETSSEPPKLYAPWHPMRTEQAMFSSSLGQGSVNGHTVAGDSKGFFLLPCSPSHQHLCVFIYTFCSQFFWCLFQNRIVNDLAEWSFDKHWTCICTICINV